MLSLIMNITIACIFPTNGFWASPNFGASPGISRSDNKIRVRTAHSIATFIMEIDRTARRRPCAHH